MPLSLNEIRDRAVAFSKECATETNEDAEIAFELNKLLPLPPYEKVIAHTVFATSIYICANYY